jgi:protein SCO1
MAMRRMKGAFALVSLCVTFVAANVCAHPTHEALPQLDFQPPAPGSYKLHRIMPAPDGQVLNVDGKAQPLSQFTGDKITLLGFIYTSCADPEGCPRAYRVFDDLKKQMLAIPALNDKVRFVTLSFDPERDTPQVMANYGSGRLKNSKGLDWYFLTTKSTTEVLPLIDGFGQDVRYSFSKSNGKLNRELSHVLKVFLIDREHNIREIYTSTFLHPQTVMADVKTLLMELNEKAD